MSRIRRDALFGKRFRFSWTSATGSGFNGIATLRRDGAIAGIGSPNETSWLVDRQGRLIFKHADGRVSTTFDKVRLSAGKLVFEGPFHFKKGVVHHLKEMAEDALDRPSHWISARDVERIQYSKQKIVYLDIGQTCSFQLKNGSEKKIRLVSVTESRDSVIRLIRRAEVLVDVDGHQVRLVCAPYVMPTEVGGMRIQVDTTSGWLAIPKRAQLSLWDSADALVDTHRFRFPLRNYRLFSHGVQAYNEPVHLGHRDGDPAGQRFYHNYGFDLAGYEGREEVISATAGVVVRSHPAKRPSSVAIEDDRGFIWEYCHMDSIAPGVRHGERLRCGDPVGILGKRGPSGNFSHLHVGAYLSRDHLESNRTSRNLNLYPWLVTAHQEEYDRGLYAVARPHHTVLTGEKVVFDGSRSLAFDSSIASYRWTFQDGTSAEARTADRRYEKPGFYVATLWIEDARGRRDVDFCNVRVFTRFDPENVIPTIFMTYTPTERIRVDQPVSFRFWLQGAKSRPLRVDFGDGSILTDYAPYSEVSHRFRASGTHIVTAWTSVGGIPITQKIKVVVEEERKG